MNFKLNALVAAALLVAAGSANAAISTSTSGNGELFLVVNDATAGYSFVGDLGIAMDSFNSAVSQSFAMGNWAQWGGFLATAGVDLNNATFAVLAVDSTGTGAGGDRMWVTSSTAISEADVAATQNKQLGGAAPVLDGTTTVSVLNQMNANLGVVAGDMDTVANGSAYSAEGSLTYWIGNVGDSMMTKLPFSVMVDANEAANFGFMVTTGTQVSLSAVNYAQAAGQWTVGASSLNYTVAAVPEAETYAMMLAGLGLVGFMVRRRNAA